MDEDDWVECPECKGVGCQFCDQEEPHWTQQERKVGTASHHPDCICNACRGPVRPPE